MYQYFIVNDILNEKQINKLKKHIIILLNKIYKF